MKRRVVLFACLFFAVWAQAAQRQLRPGFNLFSKEQDIQLGKEAAAQIEQKSVVVRDKEIEEYVARIGRKLAAQPEADKYPYTFKVVQDKTINAFALPGGPTYLHTGLITAADNEAQVAGVMAHEISHVALRHGTNQASKASGLQILAAIGGSVVSRGGSMLGQLAQFGIGLGANSVLLKYSRNAERDADLLGARIMSQAGYDPREMARFFQKLEAETGSRGGAFAQFLSDHPNPGNRIKSVEEEIRTMPQRRYDADTGQFSRIKSLVSRLPQQAPPKQAAAAVPGGIGAASRPSGRYREYRGREFSLSYPDNWQVLAGQNQTGITIAPQDGVVASQSGAPAVAMGVITGSYTPQDRSANLESATSELLGQLQQNNPGMRVGQTGTRRTQAGGQAALTTALISQSPFEGQNEIDTLLTVLRPQGLFYVVFVAPEKEYAQVRGAFEQMAQSLRFLN